MNARLGSIAVLLLAGLCVRGAAAQEPPPAPPVTPPSDLPPPAPLEPPAAPPAAPPAENPPVEAPPPVLAPLPAEPAPGPPPAATFPPLPPASASAPAPPPPARTPAPTPYAEPEAPPSAPPTSSNPPSEPRDENPRERGEGLFGPFRIGPLFGLGLPSFFSFGGEIRLTRYFGAGVNVGIIPAMHFAYYGDATVSYQDYGAYAHIHPFGGGFLLGAALGYARVRGSYDSSVNTSMYASLGAPSALDVHSEGSVETLILTPQIGYVYTWRAGFTFGFDVGAQIPVASSRVTFEDDVNGGNLPKELIEQFLAPDREKVKDTLEKVGQTILPAFHLRIGWLL